VSTPRYPHQDDETTPVRPVTWKTKAIMAAVLVVLVLVIALHAAHVFGP